MNKGYLICEAEGSSFYIPKALHIEKNDTLNVFKNDTEASAKAEKDGIKLICGMKGVPNHVYIDTEENRCIILEMLKKYPSYEKVSEIM